MKLDSALRNVVLPLPVPPAIKMLWRETTSFLRKSTASGVIAPYPNSFSMVIGFFGNLLIVTVGPLSATGGKTTCTLEPSSSLASTIGFPASMVRSISLTNFCTILIRSSSLSKCSSSCISFPDFSTNIRLYPLIITSVISVSVIILPRIPSPPTDSVTVYLSTPLSLKDIFW